VDGEDGASGFMAKDVSVFDYHGANAALLSVLAGVCVLNIFCFCKLRNATHRDMEDEKQRESIPHARNECQSRKCPCSSH
jgi:hypothetical protein